MKRAMSAPLSLAHYSLSLYIYIYICVCVCVCWGIRKHLPIHTAPLHMHIRIRDDDSQTIFIGKLYLFLVAQGKGKGRSRGRDGMLTGWTGCAGGKFQHQQHLGRICTRMTVRASECAPCWPCLCLRFIKSMVYGFKGLMFRVCYTENKSNIHNLKYIYLKM